MSDVAKIKEVRERTGIGFGDCKKALAESDWEVEAAINFIRKQSSVKAAKKAVREAAEGRLMLSVNDDASAGSIVEVNVETDFAARNERFVAFCEEAANAVLNDGPEILDSLEKARQELVQTIGENVSVRRGARLTGDPGTIVSYLHTNNTVGSLVEIKNGSEGVNLDVAMHITAMSPLVVNVEQLPEAVIEKEKQILLDRAKSEDNPKPPEIIERIVDGQLRKFQAESCLLNQAFVRDPKTTVAEILNSEKAEVIEFVRYQVGESID